MDTDIFVDVNAIIIVGYLWRQGAGPLVMCVHNIIYPTWYVQRTVLFRWPFLGFPLRIINVYCTKAYSVNDYVYRMSMFGCSFSIQAADLWSDVLPVYSIILYSRANLLSIVRQDDSIEPLIWSQFLSSLLQFCTLVAVTLSRPGHQNQLAVTLDGQLHRYMSDHIAFQILGPRLIRLSTDV